MWEISCKNLSFWHLSYLAALGIIPMWDCGWGCPAQRSHGLARMLTLTDRLHSLILPSWHRVCIYPCQMERRISGTEIFL